MIAPDFPKHLEWLNTDRRYTLNDLKGRFILLDFWTYCCINCMHVIPELRRLEERHPELVVIGVHSAKFQGERAKENIMQAVLRYGIMHPVIIDNDLLVWRTYGIRAWPSFILIGPDGQIIGRASGEDIFERLDAVLQSLGKKYRELGMLDLEPMRFALPKGGAGESFLRFPGKVEADLEGRRLFISDSNHNRIVVASPDGDVLIIIGSGEEGSSDGSFGDACFFRPQGMAFDSQRNCLYIADTENHLIRRADIGEMVVTTILGSGRKGYPPEGGRGPGLDLNSPWDLAMMGDRLYIAMAGDHQIWSMDPDTLQAQVYAGTGQEGIIDGPVHKAALAQPSGLATDGLKLFIADSEVSAIRMIYEGIVTTLIGRGLFDFGDADGPFAEAELQHPLGVLYHQGSLYIADSYNNKIKKADIPSMTVSTLVGGGPGSDPSSAGLREPNDISFLDGRFYIADTNNHMIRVYDPGSREVYELKINEGAPPECARAVGQIDLLERSVSLKAGGIHFKIELPSGYHWNSDAEQQIEAAARDDLVEVLPIIREGEFSYFIPLRISGPSRTALSISVGARFCSYEGLCLSSDYEFNLPLAISEGGPDDIEVVYRIIPRPSS